MLITLNLQSGGTIAVDTDDIIALNSTTKGSTVTIENAYGRREIDVYEVPARILKFLGGEK